MFGGGVTAPPPVFRGIAVVPIVFLIARWTAVVVRLIHISLLLLLLHKVRRWHGILWLTHVVVIIAMWRLWGSTMVMARAAIQSVCMRIRIAIITTRTTTSTWQSPVTW